MDRSSEDKRKETEAFYKAEIMPLLQMGFKEKYFIESKCEGLILTLGTSYEPLVFSISALNPEKVLILYTKETQELLDDVIEFTKLRPSKYKSDCIDSENPLMLYKKIKEVYDSWGRPDNIYVDFTGGTKSMAAGCAMAGSAIGAQLIYVGGDYIPTLRKPEPGSEKLCFIDSPYKVFGDLERLQAVNLFNRMDYVSAFRIFEELNSKVPGTNEYLILAYLAKAYDAWDSFNLNGAKAGMEECLNLLSRESAIGGSGILNDFKEIIAKQIQTLEILCGIHHSKADKKIAFENISYLMINLYNNALRREKQEKYEMASLLLYRVLEMIEQKRLWNYRLDVSEPEYNKLQISPDELLVRINKIRSKMKGFDPLKELDDKISLLSGYTILAALGDEIIKTNKPGKENILLMEIRMKVETRNKSIFAHGFEFINRDMYLDFKFLVEEYLNKFYDIEGIAKEELVKSMSFIEL